MFSRYPQRSNPVCPPWYDIERLISLDMLSLPNTNQNIFSQYIDNNYKHWCHIYSDGSQIKDTITSTACGIYVPHMNMAKSWKLNPNHTVQYAELFAIIQSLKIAAEIPQTKVMILTDSKTSLQMILHPSRNYSVLTSLIQKIVLQLNETKSVHLVWLRGHAGIRGNDIADRAAKQGHNLNQITETPLTFSEHICLLNKKSHQYWEKVWKEKVHSTGVGKHLLALRENIKHLPWTKHNDRRTEVVMNRLRLGHAGLNSYMFRFEMHHTDECPNCYEAETIEHFFLECPEYEDARLILRRELQLLNAEPVTVKTLLGGSNLPPKTNFKIARKVAWYIKATNRMQDL